MSPLQTTDIDTDKEQKTSPIGERKRPEKKRPPESFNRFWNIYPRGDGKKAAARIWVSANLDALADQIIADVQERKKSDPQWRDVKFIPYASTYLNQERWADRKPAGLQFDPESLDGLRARAV